VGKHSLVPEALADIAPLSEPSHRGVVKIDSAVSVVIPTYNRLWALPRSVAQFYDDPVVGEILVVNDASTDGTRQWLDEEAQRHPVLRPVHNPENRGATGARNTGIDAARCDDILFWDDDMLLMPAGGLGILMSELLRYDLIACRNNWRMLRRRRRAIRSGLRIRMPIVFLQAIFVCDRLLYWLPRKLAGHVPRGIGL
jgi:glycosyltransferase involved in cell wall biosynthesis